ncbi:MAG: cytochrome c oxidase subunit II [Caulobacterales bacterium]
MNAPLNLLTSSGAAAGPVAALTWGLLAISIAVVLIITFLVVAGILRRQVPLPPGGFAEAPVERAPGGLRWITIGLAVSTVALVVSLVWTVATLAAVSGPPTRPTLTIRVTGRQGWWQADYLSPANPSLAFTTANELHSPVGQPVRVELVGGDVIHSFWVPQLAGKTDTIPGRTNLAWIEADRPGTYWGQCTEYCGQQHAHMAFKVVAESPQAFQSWRQAQLVPGPRGLIGDALAGQQLFNDRCGACHRVRGTDAGGSTGPDLTHLMSRTTIAAGTEPNTRGSLGGWIANPQAVKPGTTMPTLYLSGPQLASVTAYLETLK